MPNLKADEKKTYAARAMETVLQHNAVVDFPQSQGGRQVGAKRPAKTNGRLSKKRFFLSKI
ncbi:hypothetical protein D1823_18055 [Ruegeria sp. AD91A]|nr:hypothetical protein D1823_18055 [Ruegeria sp. AD91A]